MPDLAPGALPLGVALLHPNGRGHEKARVSVAGHGQEASTAALSVPEGE